MAALRVVTFFGIVLSCYALYIEHQKVLNPEYEALCDVGSSVSCSKVCTASRPHPRLSTAVARAARGESRALGLIVSADTRQVFTSEWGRMLSHFGVVEAGSVFDVPNAALGASAPRPRPKSATNASVDARGAAVPGVVFYLLVFLYPSVRHLPGVPSLLFLASLASCVRRRAPQAPGPMPSRPAWRRRRPPPPTSGTSSTPC